MTLGEYLHEQIRLKGLKPSAVARQLNVERQTVNNFKTRKTFPASWIQELKGFYGIAIPREYAYQIEIDAEYKEGHNVSDVVDKELAEPQVTYSKTTTLTFKIDMSDDMNIPSDFNERVKNILLGKE